MKMGCSFLQITGIPNEQDKMWTRISFLIFTFSVLIRDSVLVTGREEVLRISPPVPVVSVGATVELVCHTQCPNSQPNWEKTIDSAPGKITFHPLKAVLRIDKVLESYENDYKCTTKCRGKFYSKDVYLAVYSFPQNPSVELTSLNPVAGQTVTLRCSGQNLYPCHKVKVYWYQSHELLPDPEEPTVTMNDHLCNTVSHRNYTTTSKDRDLTFTCEIRLGLPTAEFQSKNSSLEIHLNTGLYDVWIEPVQTVEHAGRPLSLSCGAGSSNVPTITWRKADSGSMAPSHWNISQGTRYSTLYTEKLEAGDRGVYICEISDGESHTQRQSSVEVWYGPQDVSIEGGGSARESETLVLTCQGDANPEANITWGRREAGDEQLRWNISKSRGKSELRIDSLRRDDQGLYECVVENPLGTVRLEARLNVEYRPRDVSIDGGGSARESETLVLTCQGDANPEANITWGRREAGDEQLRWNISKSRGKSELRIDSLRRDDQGLYECVVENPLGTVRLEAQLNVEFPVKPDLEDIILGLCVPLVSLLGIGVLIYLIRKRLFKDLTQGKSSMSEDRSSNVPPSAPMQSSPC
ncbi:vascular cell adhesion protein 1-like isoform X1 [Chiloscyllium punctatum]|uniref:vascular cell adhesion protein 1-like isoform X1 n=1 Tax=Chiloscyllium punctatum TaxID=137246 RepID=UPI003B637B50